MKHHREEPNRPLDQQSRIEQLRRQLHELSEGQFLEGDMGDCPPDLKEQFLQRVLEFESRPRTTLKVVLEERGWRFMEPVALSRHEVGRHLWELIRAMASVHVYLDFTAHMSDRELYDYRWNPALVEEDVYLPDDPAWICQIDPIGSGSEEHTRLYLRYYADEFWRESWTQEFPEDSLPARETPPYDRDRHLPRPPGF